MTYITATPADTELFNNYAELSVTKGFKAARDLLEGTLEETKLRQGNSASLDQYSAFILLQWKELRDHKPVVSSNSMEAMRPTIDLANRTINESHNKQWNGASSIKIYLDVIREMQALSIQLQVTSLYPHGAALNALGQMPNRLLLALSCLSAEAFPAIVNAAPNQPAAIQACRVAVSMINRCAVIPLMEAHEELLYEREQCHELGKWSALEGSFLRIVQTLPDVFGELAALTKTHAPQSNPQAFMLKAEARHYLKELNETLMR